MEIRVLEYFVMIAKEGNITRAADRLHITQPTLSRQINELEVELKTKLFIRGKRSIVLTESGQLLMQRAQELLSLVAKTERDLQESQPNMIGTVSIGCVESKASQKLAEWIKSFLKIQPHVMFEIVSGNGDNLREKLDKGLIDLAILLEPIEIAKYDSIHLNINEKWGIILPINHALSSMDQITVDQLKSIPLVISNRSIVQDDLKSWLGVSHDDLNIVATHTLLTNSLQLLKEDIAYPVSIEGALLIRNDENVRFIPLHPERLSRHVLAWKKNQLMSPITRIFIQHINDAQ